MATQDEWASLALVLSKHYVGLAANDALEAAHCRQALGVLQRVAEVAP